MIESMGKEINLDHWRIPSCQTFGFVSRGLQAGLALLSAKGSLKHLTWNLLRRFQEATLAKCWVMNCTCPDSTRRSLPQPPKLFRLDRMFLWNIPNLMQQNPIFCLHSEAG